MPPRKTVSEKLSEVIDLMTEQRYAPAMRILVKLQEAVAKKDAISETKVKRKPSTYNKFVKDNYADIKARNPNIAQKDIMKAIGEEWRRRNDGDGDEEEVKPKKRAPAAKNKRSGGF